MAGVRRPKGEKKGGKAEGCLREPREIGEEKGRRKTDKTNRTEGEREGREGEKSQTDK